MLKTVLAAGALAAATLATPASASVVILNYNWGNVFQFRGIDAPLCGEPTCTYTTTAYLDFDGFDTYDTSGTLTFTTTPYRDALLLYARGPLRFDGRNGLVLEADLATRKGFFEFPNGRRVEFNDMANGIPEPATWAMMIAGFGLTGAAVRRRSPAHATA